MRSEFDMLFDAADDLAAGKPARVKDAERAAEREADRALWAARAAMDVRRVRVQVALWAARSGLAASGDMPEIPACKALANVPDAALLELKLTPEPFERAIRERDIKRNAEERAAKGEKPQLETFLGHQWRNNCWPLVFAALNATFGGELTQSTTVKGTDGDVTGFSVYDIAPPEYIQTCQGRVRIKNGAAITWRVDGMNRAAAVMATERPWRNVVKAIVDGINSGRAPRQVLNQVRDQYDSIAKADKERRAAKVKAATK